MLESLRDQLSSLPAERTGQVLTAGVVIVLLVLVGNQCLAIYRAAVYAPAYETATPVTQPATGDGYNATVITRRNLFGASAGGPESLRDSNLPTTSLALTLRGVFTSSSPGQASAIIERPDGATRSFQVNAMVAGNTRLHAVFDDRIVLSTNGELETLYFPDPSERASTSESTDLALSDLPSGIQDRVRDNMSGEEIQRTQRQLNSPALTPEQRKALIRQRLLELRERAREQRNNQ